MKVAGLFAGIGGIERGLAKAGHEAVLFCEADPAARAVLEHRFPSVPINHDVRGLEKLPRGVQLLTAGFPCQDLSQAGKTKGIRGAQSGLISGVLKQLDTWRTPWVLLENVPFLLHLQGGRGIRLIVDRLEKIGYRWAYRVIDTRSFGIPQRRERLYLLASLDADPAKLLFANDREPPEAHGYSGQACGFYWTEGNRGLGWAVDAIPPLKGGSGYGIPSPPAIWLPEGSIVTPSIQDAELLQGLTVDWTRACESVAKRSYRWHLVGNAVTSDVAAWLGKLLTRVPGELPTSVVALMKCDRWPRAAFGSKEAGRFKVSASPFPTHHAATGLREFLRYEPRPLSAAATRGFADRLASSSLWRPKAFERALRKHVRAMERLQ